MFTFNRFPLYVWTESISKTEHHYSRLGHLDAVLLSMASGIIIVINIKSLGDHAKSVWINFFPLNSFRYSKSKMVAIHKSISSIAWFWAVFQSYNKTCRPVHSTIRPQHRHKLTTIRLKICLRLAHFSHFHATHPTQMNWGTFWPTAQSCWLKAPFSTVYPFNKSTKANINVQSVR